MAIKHDMNLLLLIQKGFTRFLFRLAIRSSNQTATQNAVCLVGQGAYCRGDQTHCDMGDFAIGSDRFDTDHEGIWLGIIHQPKMIPPKEVRFL